MRKENVQYIVTAINRLTKERVPVTKPGSKDEIVRLRDVLAAHNNSKSVYSLLKVEMVDTQLKIPFPPQ